MSRSNHCKPGPELGIWDTAVPEADSPCYPHYKCEKVTCGGTLGAEGTQGSFELVEVGRWGGHRKPPGKACVVL